MPHELKGLRLLIVGDWPPPIGGVAVHVSALRNAARNAGAEVTVIDIGRGQTRDDGVIPSGNELTFFRQLASSARSANLVHLHTSGANRKSWILTSLVGATSSLAGTRSLVTFHSGHAPRYINTPARALAARMAVAPYTRVICVSEEISRSLRRIGAAEHRHVIAPAFGVEGVRPAALPHEAAALIKDHSPIISAMLAPGRDYGARELFEAFALLRSQKPGAVLVVYGSGTDWRETEWLAHGAGANPIVRLGTIERAEAQALMQASDLFVRPTFVDGDSVSVREALALGCRVVATRVGARPTEATLCAPGDAKDLARAMNEALAKPKPERNTGDDGIAAVVRLYGQLLRTESRTAA